MKTVGLYNLGNSKYLVINSYSLLHEFCTAMPSKHQILLWILYERKEISEINEFEKQVWALRWTCSKFCKPCKLNSINIQYRYKKCFNKIELWYQEISKMRFRILVSNFKVMINKTLKSFFPSCLMVCMKNLTWDKTNHIWKTLIVMIERLLSLVLNHGQIL